VKGSEGLIVGLERIDRNFVDACSLLRVISKYGVGVDNIDLDYCREKGIVVRWKPGINKTSVAEMTLAFMIMLIRNIFKTSTQLKEGTWNKSGGFNLSGKTIGIIGVGNVGKEVVRLLTPFHCNILVNDIVDQSAYYRENGLTEASKEFIYMNCDIISIHTPLTNETRYLINRETFSMMKKSAFLINTARGGIVKGEDLKWALMNRIIDGAAVDVYEKEPPEDKELLSLPNLLCTPHIGGNSQEAVLAMGRSAIQHLKEYFNK
jgi:D-3-phosphoglycerate dehydrogenase